MNDPIKIILKYKNQNRRIQYHTYIFIGSVSKSIISILNKIENLSLYDGLILLSKLEYNRIEKYYGSLWYKKFYNTHHINYTIHIIKKSPQQRQELSNKYGKTWYKTHVIGHTLVDKKIFYSYDAKIKEQILRMEMKRKREFIEDDKKQINYTTKNISKSDIYRQFSIESYTSSATENTNESSFLSTPIMSPTTSPNLSSMELTSSDDVMYNAIGGGKELAYNELTRKELNTSKLGDDDGDGVIEFEEGLEPYEKLPGEEMELEEMEKLYQNMDVDPDKNITKTSELIKKMLKDEKIFSKIKIKMVKFDESRDKLMYDEDIKKNYSKYYVTTQYIFKDDTIKMIKNKICCSIINNSKFGKNSYIIPSRQYLWSEYYFNNKLEKIMIGQKWITRSNLLHIDIEPNNNIAIYEELRGNLKILRNNIKRFGTKITRKDDDYNILYDYDKYYMNNEIYMRDLYNELGHEYLPDAESLRNIFDVYVGVYYPRIPLDDIKYIIKYLNNDDETEHEHNNIAMVYENINNDLILENQIMKDVEDVKKNPEHKKLFKTNYVTQSVIHVHLRIVDNKKINLYDIFDKFVNTEKYPFIQYLTADGQPTFKWNEQHIDEYTNKKENINVLLKWFENAPYGISFKVKIEEKNVTKFMAVNLNETGKMDYKTQWKENDMATIDDIKNTHNYVKNLIKKLNKENDKIQIELPEDHEFKFAFINTIQHFVLPDKKIINHNDLSEFSRYFYPYIAVVIEPRKRRARIKKIIEVSKYGTYLRYKRVSKYENKARIEQRILYFMRNYNYTDKSLSDEISKQFNITMENAMTEINRVIDKYKPIKKSRKILKKLENIPKNKPPGIGIDIQGKTRDKYKIRISGARNKEQLNRIITFMNILIWLYSETYLLKRPERKQLKEKLKELTNIARRRHKVADIVEIADKLESAKQMAQFDKKRIGFKPEKRQNGWTRSCQNSGKDKRRRPKLYITEFDVKKNGFKLNKKTGVYNKKIRIKKNGKRKEVIIKAVALKSTSEEGAQTVVYYACGPANNGEHMYVGFLSRSNNPFGQCMPCCFKKDQMVSKNKNKRNYFLKCMGK